MELYIFSALTITFASFAIITTYKYFEARRRFDEMKIQYAISSQEEIKLQSSVTHLEHENIKLRDRSNILEANFTNLKDQYIKLESEKNAALGSVKQAEKLYYEARTAIELANQKVVESEKRNNDIEKQRQLAFKDAREAMFSTGREVFTKEAEEVTKKTFEQFGKIVEKVNALSNNVDTTSKDIKTVIKSMSSPTAIGQFSEVGLANILKEYGLVEGRDFVVQYSIGAGEGAKRPDAVLFIRDNIFIIDSKASKFFLDFAEAQSETHQIEALESIKKTMNLHLNSLASKNYRAAVIDDIRKTRADFTVGHVQTVMFLCNEAHINIIADADPEFISKAIAKDIVISGPTGLHGLLAFARYSIDRASREENQELLMNEVRNMLGSISTMLAHAAKVGSGIKASAKHYEHLVASVNRTLLPKLAKINKLGIAMPGNKPLPTKLESFEIVTHSQQLIEAEAVVEESTSEEEENNKMLELMNE